MPLNTPRLWCFVLAARADQGSRDSTTPVLPEVKDYQDHIFSAAASHLQDGLLCGCVYVYVACSGGYTWWFKIGALEDGCPGLNHGQYSQVAPAVKNLPASARDERGMALIPGSGRSLGRGHGNPLHYFCLEKPRDGGTW